jgi:sialic acid synthase SpsE
MGAQVIEKHFTLNRLLPGPDHQASLEPKELKAMIAAIRDVECALGDGIKSPSAEEEAIKRVARKSIVAQRDINPGEILGEDALAVKRPGTGIEPKYSDLLIQRKAKKKILKNQIITWDMIE